MRDLDDLRLKLKQAKEKCRELWGPGMQQTEEWKKAFEEMRQLRNEVIRREEGLES